MKLSQGILLHLAAVVIASSSSDVKKVSGVPPDNQALYKPDGNNNWACLNHPDIVISFDRVNDDYCDCPDGSDEPGTAACPNNVFYCANKGHIPAFIPSSMVNDGVCDYELCCDGSDETGNEFVNCPDRCAEINKVYKKGIDEEQKRVQGGLKAKQKLVAVAKQARDETQEEIVELEKKLASLTTQRVQHQQSLDQAIAKDREEKLASGVSADELEMPVEIKQAVEKLQELTTARQKSLERVAKLRDQYNELKQVMDRMKEGYNPNFNDPAIKNALREFDDVKSKEEVIGDIQSTGDEWQSVIDNLKQYRAVGGKGGMLPGWAQAYVGQARQWAVENGILAEQASSSTNHESEPVRQARELVESTENSVQETKSKIKELTDDLVNNYGKDDILRALKEECVKNHIGEYDYEVCFFKSASQNGNGHNVNLGQFERLNFDEESGEISIDFNHGTRCWNGPIRTSKVSMTCGIANQILTVSEPEKCEYHFKMVGPAACQEIKQDTPHHLLHHYVETNAHKYSNHVKKQIVHDEL